MFKKFKNIKLLRIIDFLFHIYSAPILYNCFALFVVCCWRDTVYIASIGERFINYPIINMLNIPKDSFFLVPLFFFFFHYFLYTLHPKSAP